MSVRKIWTEDDEIYLEYYLFGDNEREKSYDAAAEFLEVPNERLIKKVHKMRIKNKNIGYIRKPYTEKEVEFIKQTYRMWPTQKISEQLGRSQDEIMRKAKSLGITKLMKIRDYDKQIRDLAKQGRYKAEIERILGLNPKSVGDYINRNEIECQRAPRKASQKEWRDDETIRHHHIKHKTYLK